MNDKELRLRAAVIPLLAEAEGSPDRFFMASEYQSKRHIGWVEKTYNRLLVLPIGKDKRLNDLRDALHSVKEKQEAW